MHYDLWFAVTNACSITAELLICIHLWRSHKIAEWQALFILCAFGGASDIVQACLQANYALYFYEYWASRTITAGLQIYLIADIIRSLPGQRAISATARQVFAMAAILIGLGSGWISFHTPISSYSRISEIALLTNRSADLAWGAFAASALAATLVMNMSWRVQGSRIMCGYIVAMCVRVIASSNYISHSKAITTIASKFEALVWAAVCVYWLISLCRPNPASLLTPDQTVTIRRQISSFLRLRRPHRTPSW